jgi:hypothetical protein
MFPSSFDESNAVLSAPDGLEEQIECLSVFRGMNDGGMPVVVSCWKPTKEELLEIAKTGRIWLICAGETQPPAILQGHSPFRK